MNDAEKAAIEQAIADNQPDALRERIRQLESAVDQAESALRREAGRTKTIYGGSDFAPLDYKVLTGSPATLIGIADNLRQARTGATNEQA